MLEFVGTALFSVGIGGEHIFKITMSIKNLMRKTEILVRGMPISYILMSIGLIGAFIVTAILAILTGYPIPMSDAQSKIPWKPSTPEETAWWERFQQYLSESQSVRIITNLLLLFCVLIFIGAFIGRFIPQGIKLKISDALRERHIRIICLLSGVILFFWGRQIG